MDGFIRRADSLMNAKVTEYINDKNTWTQELNLLRFVLLEVGFEETVKWGAPVYVHKGKNIVGLSAFKNYCGLWFFQGSFLIDEQKKLVNAQEGKTQAMRQWRFFTVEDIQPDLVKQYALEAIKNSEEGKELKVKRNTKPLSIPDELQLEFDKDERLKEAFNGFSLSKQREFSDYISEAKREATKQKRLEKIIPMILNGVGLYDKYKNC
ncbi:YdeI/OmpD-associated family protein [Tenacibaculum sp. L6]|uniref:YdeI/OmpD-associated family protein n=1 Tax=Tenacibaculum sp. L6 TaxID=2992764 RepID=UPI00237AAB83|nr:YdeI/OmpD-associated family protein [Tenacibaculum sp. L6]MDE0535642.1 YdeI/OmpD-associated family protein [Tenacibaculum sp. L6]